MQVKAVLLFLGELGGGEILVILVIVLLLFGAKRIPAFARSLGSGIREFKDAVQGMRNELERTVEDEQAPSSSPTDTRPVEPGTPFIQPPAPASGPDRAQEPGKPLKPGDIE
jgi:sec-independent protein translocase protein TatA